MSNWVHTSPRPQIWQPGDGVKTVALLAGLAAIAALVGYVILGGLGLLIGAVAVAIAAGAGFGVSDQLVMRLQGAHPLAYWQAPGLYRRVARLARRAGVAPPQLYLAPGIEANAVTVRSGEGSGALAVTRGTLEILDSHELDGVLAHEIAHLANGDTEIMQLTSWVSRATVTLLRIATWIAVLGVLLTGGGVARAGLLTILALAVPVLVELLLSALSRTRELAADATAAMLTGSPRALASALAKLERYHHGWLGRLFVVRKPPPWLRTHPPTDERIRRLLAIG